MTATRFTQGAISLSSSSHLPLMLNSNAANPVALLPGRDSRIDRRHKHNRDGAACLLKRAHDLPQCSALFRPTV
jgi:hypothetical protein